MEDGERIPIVLEQAAETDGGTLLADGTVVYDIHAPPCYEQTELSEVNSIVVCGESERTAEFESEAAAQDQPQAVKLQLGENADATLIGSTTRMPMGGFSQDATVRVRVEF